MPPAGLSQRSNAVAAWVDGTFVVVGGRDTPPCPPNADCALPAEPALRDGARYDPVSNAWTPLPDAPRPIEHASVAVVDRSLYVWLRGGIGRPGTSELLAYDAAANRWQRPAQPGPDHGDATLTSGGDRLILYAGSHEIDELRDLVYDPRTDRWDELPADPLAPAYDRTMVAADSGELVLLAIPLVPNPGVDPPLYHAAAFDPAARSWRRMETSEVVGGYPQWVASGGRIVNPSLGGADGGQTNGWGRTYPYGGALDVATGTWEPLRGVPEEDAAGGGSAFPMAGDADLVVGWQGWALTPASGEWHRLELPVHAADAEQAGAVGDGRYLLWGGVRWSQSGRLTSTGWLWTPPA